MPGARSVPVALRRRARLSGRPAAAVCRRPRVGRQGGGAPTISEDPPKQTPPPEQTPDTPRDFHHMAGQSDAKAHYKTPGRPTGAPRRHRGRLGLWVLLRFCLTLAGHVVEIPQIFWSLFRGWSLFCTILRLRIYIYIYIHIDSELSIWFPISLKSLSPRQLTNRLR